MPQEKLLEVIDKNKMKLLKNRYKQTLIKKEFNWDKKRLFF